MKQSQGLGETHVVELFLDGKNFETLYVKPCKKGIRITLESAKNPRRSLSYTLPSWTALRLLNEKLEKSLAEGLKEN